MNVGNKAANLHTLKDNGFNVPDFFVLSPLLAGDSAAIRRALDGKIDAHRKYAVRSSGIKEDLPGFSFAGQYYTCLNVQGLDAVAQEAEKCYASVSSRTVTAYLKRNNMPTTGLQLAVIIQDMVAADYSGVAFSVNPLTGADKEVVIEVAPGLGDAIVSGRVNPQEYIYDWYDQTFVKTGNVISEQLARDLSAQVLKIQVLFGYPCDVEFAVKDGVIFILQARAVTKILYGSIRDEWTTADFKDGGVSSTVCKPFMWSLYEYIWEIAYRHFLHSALLLEKKRMSKLGDMFFSRPYWNLSMAKLAMAKVPGYKEREFDNDLGVTPTYEGDGVTTGLTARSLLSALIVLAKNKVMVRARLRSNAKSKQRLLDIYEQRLANVSDSAEAWKSLVFNDYLLSESTYFNQIFINTVAQSIYRDALLKHVSRADYLKLLMGLDDVSHLRPYQAIWELSRQTTVSDGDIDAFIKDFGYHSVRELDVSYPHFAEDRAGIAEMIKKTTSVEDVYSPTASAKEQQSVYLSALARVPEKLHPLVNEMRLSLWWREELRDVSTRFYYLVRLYTVELARSLQARGVIGDTDDIWFAKIGDIKEYLDGTISASGLRALITKNQTYYQSFRNFTPENEVGHAFDGVMRAASKAQAGLSGIGCSTGVVVGVARVIKDIAEIDKIQPDDILVTKFTDTGWTSKFAILKGVVTEYGGVLCHAAIVSREYGIPCVVCATGIMDKVQDGQKISVNGETGEVRIVKS